MMEVFLMQSLLFMIPVFIVVLTWLLMDIVLDVIDSLERKKATKAHHGKKPTDKTKEYFDL